MNHKLRFKIGSDPEFTITLRKAAVPASEIVSAVFNNKLERNGAGFLVGNHGNIGWDGCSSTGEIRPKESYIIEKHVENIGKLFEAFNKEAGLFDLTTRNEWAPVGGHIHFELPPNTSGNSRFLNDVHHKLASFYLPLLLGEDRINLRLRYGGQGYGCITDRRSENGRTLEFRAPAAEWITTPTIAQATLAYMATVYNEILAHPKNINKHKDFIYTRDSDGKSLQELTLNGYAFLMKILSKKVKSAIRSFELYPIYKNEIELMLNPEKVLKMKQKVNYSIVQGWGLDAKDKLNQKILLSSKKTTQLIKGKHVESFSSLLPIYVNNDNGVTKFADEFKRKIVAHSWKIKNRYVLFGLREQFAGFIIRDWENKQYYGRNTIHSRDEYIKLDEIFLKIRNKFGLNNTKDNPIMIIGIPRNERLENNTRNFIKLVFNLENKEPKPEDIGPDFFESLPQTPAITTTENELTAEQINDIKAKTTALEQQAIAARKMSDSIAQFEQLEREEEIRTQEEIARIIQPIETATTLEATPEQPNLKTDTTQH